MRLRTLYLMHKSITFFVPDTFCCLFHRRSTSASNSRIYFSIHLNSFLFWLFGYKENFFRPPTLDRERESEFVAWDELRFIEIERKKLFSFCKLFLLLFDHSFTHLSGESHTQYTKQQSDMDGRWRKRTHKKKNGRKRPPNNKRLSKLKEKRDRHQNKRIYIHSHCVWRWEIVPCLMCLMSVWSTLSLCYGRCVFSSLYILNSRKEKIKYFPTPFHSHNDFLFCFTHSATIFKQFSNIDPMSMCNHLGHHGFLSLTSPSSLLQTTRKTTSLNNFPPLSCVNFPLFESQQTRIKYRVEQETGEK